MNAKQLGVVSFGSHTHFPTTQYAQFKQEGLYLLAWLAEIVLTC